MAIFKADEILQFAKRVEENGEKFYRHAAEITEDEEARYLFNHLADEEIKHGQIFAGMLANLDLLSRMEAQAPAETYPGEYYSYLRNYIDGSVIFTRSAESDFRDIRDTLAAINFAIDREVDSILYYTEIKRIVPSQQHKTIDGIIDEERRHFMQLSDYKKDYEKRSGR
ncbi:MAG: ferritin family protein [Syntrophales bacterium]|nr:ferritin family protein [Syntrophales bacterium]MDD5233987.1 ferritin family protein [Syntrophales bacterium]MDD5532440.1 ferritin family protein [Syntrophales bacterium]